MSKTFKIIILSFLFNSCSIMNFVQLPQKASTIIETCAKTCQEHIKLSSQWCDCNESCLNSENIKTILKTNLKNTVYKDDKIKIEIKGNNVNIFSLECIEKLEPMMETNIEINEQKETLSPTEFTHGMDVEEFKRKNENLLIVENTSNGIIYSRKDCTECNLKYYVFINKKLQAVSSIHFPLEKVKFHSKTVKDTINN